jgi:hypothetical protein
MHDAKVAPYIMPSSQPPGNGITQSSAFYYLGLRKSSVCFVIALLTHFRTMATDNKKTPSIVRKNLSFYKISCTGSIRNSSEYIKGLSTLEDFHVDSR